MYKKIFAVHSWMGLVSGLILLVVGFSGSVLLFKDELDGLFRPRLVRAAGPGLSWNGLLGKVREQVPEVRVRALDIEWSVHPARSVRLELEGPPRYPNYSPYLYLNPRDGKVLGREQGGFLDWLYYLHFELLLGWVGRGFLFFFGVALFLLGASGIYLYRGWFRLFAEPIRKGGSSRTFLADWHKLIGVASLLMLMILGFTGAWMNFQIFPWFAGDWKRLGMVGLVGDWYNKTSAQNESLETYPSVDVDLFLRMAAGDFAEMRPVRLEMPRKAGDLAVLYGGVEGWGVFLGNDAYEVKWDPVAGRILGAKTPSQLSFFEVSDNIFDILHMGRFGGLPVRVLYAFAGVAPGLLAVTGFLMFLKRNRHP